MSLTGLVSYPGFLQTTFLKVFILTRYFFESLFQKGHIGGADRSGPSGGGPLSVATVLLAAGADWTSTDGCVPGPLLPLRSPAEDPRPLPCRRGDRAGGGQRLRAQGSAGPA